MKKEDIKEWALLLLTAVAIVLVIRMTILDNRIVPSGSMMPTIRPGDRLFVEKVTHHFGGVHPGDIVVFDPPEAANFEDDLIKRLIAVAGDSVEVKNGTLYVNDHPVDEPYVEDPMNYEMAKQTVPDGKIFVLGDNRNSSLDSHRWGFADLDSVQGKAMLIYWPLNRLHFIWGQGLRIEEEEIPFIGAQTLGE
ncbi:MAG: signal peptidase I [Peptococcaceae bacterium]|nr:signal peptidase I [Peptococcaceae bacterium]